MLVVLIGVMALSLSANGLDKKIKYPFEGEGAGYRLLNEVITPMPKDIKRENAEKSIRDVRNRILDETIKAKEMGEIDEYFFNSFMLVMKVAALNGSRVKLQERDKMLELMLLEHINMLNCRKGKKVEGIDGIGQKVNSAVVDEILLLKKYLDDKSKK